MGVVKVTAQRAVHAPAETVYGYLAGLREHRPHYLPDAISDFEVEAGGAGAGTITSYKLTAGGRVRDYRMTVSEPQPGRVLSESDSGSSLVTSYTVTPQGDSALVEIATSWNGAGGIGGFFERTFAPRAMRTIYAEELERLDAYAHSQQHDAPAA